MAQAAFTIDHSEQVAAELREIELMVFAVLDAAESFDPHSHSLVDFGLADIGARLKALRKEVLQ